VTSKSGGKGAAKRFFVSVDENFQVQEISQSRKPVNPAKPVSANSSDPDQLMQTTFRLGLKLSEQEAKNQASPSSPVLDFKQHHLHPTVKCRRRYPRVARFFLVNIYQKYTKWPQKYQKAGR
jgi:hypothetical protein